MGTPETGNPFQPPSGQVPEGQKDPDEVWRVLMLKLYGALNEAELTAHLDAIVQNEGELWKEALNHLITLMQKEQQRLQERHQKAQPSLLGKIFGGRVESDFRGDSRGRQYDSWSALIFQLREYKRRKVEES